MTVSPETAAALRELVAEALGDERMVASTAHEGLGAVIIGAQEESNQALLWIRGHASDTRPALIQTMVPFDDRPIEADQGAAEAAAAWLTAQRGRWTPRDIEGRES